jgi:hypothetical protein
LLTLYKITLLRLFFQSPFFLSDFLFPWAKVPGNTADKINKDKKDQSRKEEGEQKGRLSSISINNLPPARMPGKHFLEKEHHHGYQ